MNLRTMCLFLLHWPTISTGIYPQKRVICVTSTLIHSNMKKLDLNASNSYVIYVMSILTFPMSQSSKHFDRHFKHSLRTSAANLDAGKAMNSRLSRRGEKNLRGDLGPLPPACRKGANARPWGRTYPLPALHRCSGIATHAYTLTS